MRCPTCGHRTTRTSGSCSNCGSSLAGDLLHRELERQQRFLQTMIPDSVRQFQRQYEQMRRAFDLGDVARDIERLAPSRELAAALEASREMDRQFRDALRQPFEVTQALQAHTDELRLQQSSAFQLAESWQEQVRKALEPLARVPDLRTIADQFGLGTLEAEARSMVDRLARDQKQWFAEFEALARPMADAAAILASLHVSAYARGITVDGVEVDMAEVQRFLEVEGVLDLPDKALASAAPLAAINAKLDHLIALVQKLPGGQARSRAVVALWILLQVLWQLILNAGGGVAGAALYDKWKESKAQRKVLVRAVEHQVADNAARILEQGAIPREVLARYRLVTAGTLIIRARPTRHSARVGELHLGDVVWTVRTHARSWTLVEWRDGEDVRVRGWVFSRYLERLALPPALAVEPVRELELELVPSH